MYIWKNRKINAHGYKYMCGEILSKSWNDTYQIHKSVVRRLDTGPGEVSKKTSTLPEIFHKKSHTCMTKMIV